MKETSILAIDPATLTGWAISKEIYGTWNLRTRADESWGMKLIRFKGKFIEILNNYEIKVVAYERPAGRNTHSIITQSKIIGIIESVCEERNIEYVAYSASEVKKFATGKGNSGKPLMISAAQEKYAYQGNDDNEADALHILFLAKYYYNE
jgi:Holliday junction resolvasome RuvABC endonuclease subunit